ncbi:hypothetical protein F5146DRAFT_317919 [Armillaria mellea]|nr:hypothetical protein F5146DRAFT_317919 [Armillaria mellea]
MYPHPHAFFQYAITPRLRILGNSALLSLFWWPSLLCHERTDAPFYTAEIEHSNHLLKVFPSDAAASEIWEQGFHKISVAVNSIKSDRRNSHPSCKTRNSMRRLGLRSSAEYPWRLDLG